MSSAFRPLIAGSALLALLAIGATSAADAPNGTRPRLVVLIAVDQLRADYLERYRASFGEGGFNRFLEGGAWFTQGRYQHAATMTCAGHAVMLTGSHPGTNGIIANDWYNLAEGREEYCSRDDDASLIGIDLEGRSPKNLLVATVGDVLKMSNRGRSRVITAGGKDRSAIMLGGRLADAAYWMEDTLFVTSRYYRADMPDWARRFNSSGHATSFFGRTWDRVLPANAYDSQGLDDDPAERLKAGLGRTFPHTVGAGRQKPDSEFVEALEYSPFHDELVVAFALDAVRNEALGSDSIPDLLAIALSSMDRVGHAFGPDSHEIMDMVIRTDRLLARLFASLDAEVGLNDITVVLTSDHGVAPVPDVLNRLNPRTGALRLDPSRIREIAVEALQDRFGTDDARHWIAYHGRPWIYFDEDRLADAHIPLAAAAEAVAQALGSAPFIASAHTRSDLIALGNAGAASPQSLSFHPERSGHVMYIPRPYVIEQSDAGGTTHGSPWAYDQQVPIAFLGAGIRTGTFHSAAHVTDIAPTLAAILRIGLPPASAGRVLAEALH